MIYRLTYCNRNGDTARLDIIKGALTPVEIIEGTENPFILSYKMDKPDKSGHFMTSVADISLYESGTFNIDKLKTSNETELKVEFYINDILTWSGFVIPDFFSREIGTPAVVTMVASDRIGTLKNTSLSGLPTMITLRELTLLCLAKTGLSLPLKTMADFSHGTGVNDFFNSKILTQRLSDTKGRNVSCYDILSSILIASHSKLVQRSGEWYIVNSIQHEEGSGKLYNTATAYVNWSEVVLDFSEVTVGGRRTIMPVASSVGVYQEYGGSKTYPDNYKFIDGGVGWTVNNLDEMEARFSNNDILGFDVLTSGGGYQPVYGTRTDNPHMVVYGFRGPLNYVKSADIPVPEGYQSEVNVKFDINASGPIWNFGSHQRMAVFAVKESVTKVLTSSGGFVDLSQTTSDEYIQRIDFEGGPVLVGQLARVSTKSFTISGKLTDTGGLDGYSIHIRLYSSDRAYATVINFASINFDTVGDSAKGTIYKVEQGVDFTQVHDIETSIFGDYITSGVNGYFYDYPKDDTSSLYNSTNELTTLWTTPSDATLQPLLLHVARQKSRMFSIAHDLISVEIDVPVFDPLAIFRDCNNTRYTVVSAKFNFLDSQASVEIEQAEYDWLIMKRDFIYSYFAESGDSIKSVGGIPSGGSSGGGGAPAPQYWYLDEDGNLRTDYNAYSTKELSAYGLGPQGGGGGTMVTWGDTVNNYSLLTVEGVSKNVALSGHKHALSDIIDLPDTLSGYGITDAYTKTQVDQLLDGVGTGSVTSVGMTVPTGLTVTGSPITTSGTLALGLQSGYSIPTTAKQNNWDTAYTNNHTHSNKSVLDGITSGLITNWNTAFTNTHTHSNKAQIDLITQAHINVLNKLFIDADGNVYTTENFYSTKEVSAYGLGPQGGSGGGPDMLDSWANYTEVKADYYVPASLLVSFRNDTLSRLTSLESGSATSIETTGSGNAITSLTKSGSVITANKGLTFALESHTHTIAQITGLQTALDNKEPSFTKNTAFNKNFGTTSGTVAEGNDSRINNGQTAYNWGNHASAGYALNSSLSNYLPLTGGTMSNTNLVTNLNADLLDGYHASETAETGLLYTYRAPAVGGTNFWHKLGTLTLPTVTGSGRSKVVAQITGLANFGTNEHRILILKASTRGSVQVNGLMIKGSSTDVRVGYVNNGSNIEVWVGYEGFYNTDTNIEILNSANFTVNRATQTSMPTNFVTCPILVSATTASNVASATKLQTARTIAGVSFDGTANIAIPFANLSSKPNTLGGYGINDAYTKAESDTNLTSAINAIVTAPRNYVLSSRTDNLTGWLTINGTRSIVNDTKFGNVVQWARTSGSPADWQKQFTLVEKSSFEGGPITLFVIAKQVSTSGFFFFGWNGNTGFINTTSSNTNQIDLGGGWFVFWRSGIGPASLTSSTYFGINTISGTWQFYAVGLNMANKYGGWQLAQEDMVTLDTAQTITGEKTFSSEVFGNNGFRVNNPGVNGVGISLYYNSPATNPTYGLMFATTASKGTHGAVTGSHATYFTMNVTAGRGWIFTTDPVGTTGNVASISNTGNITASGEITAYVASDRRLKENIKPITSALDYINRLNPVTYNWNARAKELNSTKTNELDYGLIAQEVESVLPNIVHGIFDDKYKSIDYIKLIPIMIGAIKELKYEINNLKK